MAGYECPECGEAEFGVSGEPAGAYRTKMSCTACNYRAEQDHRYEIDCPICGPRGNRLLLSDEHKSYDWCDSCGAPPPVERFDTAGGEELAITGWRRWPLILVQVAALVVIVTYCWGQSGFGFEKLRLFNIFAAMAGMSGVMAAHAVKLLMERQEKLESVVNQRSVVLPWYVSPVLWVVVVMLSTLGLEPSA